MTMNLFWEVAGSLQVIRYKYNSENNQTLLFLILIRIRIVFRVDGSFRHPQYKKNHLFIIGADHELA